MSASRFPGTWLPDSVELNMTPPPEEQRAMALHCEAVGRNTGLGPSNPTVITSGSPGYDGTTDPGKPGEPV